MYNIFLRVHELNSPISQIVRKINNGFFIYNSIYQLVTIYT
jgi:hypothetical protein